MPRSLIRSRLPAAALATAALLAAIAGAPPASAQPSAAEKAEADALFTDARRLMAQKKYPEACRKLEASQKLDPAGGTLLNLALCHELEGRLATAWVEFSDALAQAKADKKPERIKIAREHVASLEGKLPKITIQLDPAATIPGLRVRRDELTVSDAIYGTAVPVDPGEHTVRAEAPGRKSWESKIHLEPGEAKTVTIPDLAQEAAPPPAASSAPPPPPPDDTRRTAGLIVGGAGVVALGVGAYFGLRTLSKKKASDDLCPTSTTCTPEGVERMDEARSSANVANVGLGLGLVGVGVGAYLLLTGSTQAPEASPSGSTSRLRLAPAASPGGGGLWVTGAF